MSEARMLALTAYMGMVTALAVTVNLILAPILAGRRDRRLAAGTAQVAVKAAEVAQAVVEVKTELSTSKDEVASHRQAEAIAFDNLQTKVDSTADKVDATHGLVNGQHTALMQKLADSQLFTLTLAQAMLEDKPNNQKLKKAVASAQALYNQSVKDLVRK